MPALVNLSLMGMVTQAAGFSLTPVCPAAELHQCAVRHAAPRCSANIEPSVTRRATLAGLLGLGIGAGSTPAYAGFVTSLGIETTKPEDADRDSELLATSKVQASLKNLAAYQSSAKALSAEFEKNTDLSLIPSIRKDFDFSAIRDDLNVVSTVFDDSTQLTIDRFSRSILYDLTELENASRFKKGEDQTRTPKKVANVRKWFDKLDADLTGFLKYFA